MISPFSKGQGRSILLERLGPRYCHLCLFQLRVFFHQLLQAEARKLYRKLSLLALALAPEHRTLAIRGMANPLARPEALLTCRLGKIDFRPSEFLSSRSEEFRDVFDGVVGRKALPSLRLRAAARRSICRS